MLFRSAPYKRYFDLAGGKSTLSTVDGTDYTTVLPSLNASIELSEELVMRLGASKGLFYPSLLETRNISLLDLDYTRRLRTPGQDQDEVSNPVVALSSAGVTSSPFRILSATFLI